MTKSPDSRSAPLPPKKCAVCGRTIEWRKQWARCWEQVRYCSDRCRGDRGRDLAGEEARILELLAARRPDASMCPSEALPPELRSDRAAMERVRQAARRLVHAGRIEILQGGRAVDPSEFRGPIRLRLRTRKEP